MKGKRRITPGSWAAVPLRHDAGAEAFACLRTYLATLRKQGQAMLAALQSVFAGHPLYPAFA